jgi:aryl-alcohol dehydrogenase-like predicted oxidoreductase
VQKTQLKTTRLGTTGMQISRVGFGAWAVGGFGWGRQEDHDSIAAIERALELGINWVDIAAVHGFGHSEAVVGRAIAGLGDDERPYVFTKAALGGGPGRTVVNDLARESILREVDNSLERLGVEAIDLYEVRWPIPDGDVEEGWATFAELKDQGLVRHIGVSNFDFERLRRIQQIAPVEVIQPPYSLLAPDGENELVPFAERERIGVLVYSPMGSGLLPGAMTRERIERLPKDEWGGHGEEFEEPKRAKNLALVGRVTAVANRLDTTPAAVAVAWTLHDPAVDGAIVGLRRPDQVDQIIAAANLELSHEDVAALEGSG